MVAVQVRDVVPSVRRTLRLETQSGALTRLLEELLPSVCGHSSGKRSSGVGLCSVLKGRHPVTLRYDYEAYHSLSLCLSRLNYSYSSNRSFPDNMRPTACLSDRRW